MGLKEFCLVDVKDLTCLYWQSIIVLVQQNSVFSAVKRGFGAAKLKKPQISAYYKGAPKWQDQD